MSLADPNTARLGPGGNNAPLEEVARDEILARLRQYQARADQLTQSADRAGITSETDAGHVSDLSKQMAVLRDAIDSARADLKGTYDRAASVVHSEAWKLLAKIDEGRGKLERMLTAYGEAEKQRRAQQAAIDAELDRRRQVEAAKAAAGSERMVHQDKAEANPLGVGKPPRQRWPERKASQPVVRGDMGSKTVMRGHDHYRIVDIRKVPDRYLLAPKVQQALISIIRLHDKSGTIPDLAEIGVEKSTEEKAQVL